MTIGDRIKDLRESSKLTQTELAEKIGTTKQNIYKYENGIITNIPSDKIELIAKLFDVSPSYIMGWTEKSAPIETDESELLSHLLERYTKEELKDISSLPRDEAVKIVEQAKKSKLK